MYLLLRWLQSHQDKGTVLLLKPIHVALSDGVTRRGISVLQGQRFTKMIRGGFPVEVS